MLCHLMFDYLDRCYNQGMCGECCTTHWQMLLPYEMELPHLLDICGFYLVYGRCYCHFVLVADVIATCFVGGRW